MIDLYTAPTVNGYRAALALEEAGLEWHLHKINFRTGDQLTPEFLAINPSGKIPVLVDHGAVGGSPLTVAQSGAILLYVAEKTGLMIPECPRRRALAYQWFMQAMTDVQATSSSIFLNQGKAPVSDQQNVEYYEGRMANFLGYCDANLKDREFMADEFSLADIALYVLVAWRKELIDRTPGLLDLRRWAEMMAERPAVKRAYATVG